MNSISKLLSTDGFIVVNKTLIRELGLHEAIILGELCSEYNYWEKCNKLDNDMFYSTRDNIEYNTGLNEHYQRKAMTTLKERGILEVKKRGVPAVNYYRINFDKLLILLSSSSSRDEGLEIDEMNLNNNKQEKQVNKEKLVSKDTNTEFLGSAKQKPKKQNLYTKCVSLIDQKTNDTEIRSLLIDWLNMLLEKYKSTGRVLYVNVFKGKLNMLNDYDDKSWEKIIKYNIMKGYEGFYPIPSYTYKTDLKDKPWEKGVKSEAYTEEEKRQIEREREEMEARGERVWY